LLLLADLLGLGLEFGGLFLHALPHRTRTIIFSFILVT
jgi:hypothetical protein